MSMESECASEVRTWRRELTTKKLLPTVLILGLLAIVAHLALAPHPSPKASRATPTAEFLAAALRKQEAACGRSLEVEYTGVWQRAGSRVPSDYEKAHYVYRRTPAALRLDKMSGKGVVDIASYDRESREYRRWLAGEGEIGRGLMSPFCTPEFLGTALYPLDDQPLCERIASGSVGDQKEKIDGHYCWRVEIPGHRSGLEKYVVWLDPHIGFCPRRIVYAWTDMQPEFISFTDYANLGDGVWFPRKQALSYGSVDKRGATFTIVNTVTRLSRGRVIPKSDMILAFPSGTRVHDATRNTTYIAP